ncbi:AMP-binding protein [Nocardia sp. 004]|uniref:AMP-binding protein n=1 Tax=Nocardia sp. 004 TaxID=3385978 RepID=UPI0039A12260
MNDNIRDNGDHIAVVDYSSGGRYSFVDVGRSVHRAALHLQQCGVRSGRHVVVTLPLGIDLVAYCHGALLLGAVPSFLDPNQPAEALAQCLATLDPSVWVCRSRQVPENVYGGTLCVPGAVTRDIPVGIADIPGRQWNTTDTVLLLYTSGTTGVPKGVPWTSRELASQIRYYRCEEITSELCLFPHLALVALAMGRRVVLPDLATLAPAHLDIATLYQQLTESGSDYVFASPLVWHRLIEHMSHHGLAPPRLRRVATAGSAIGSRLIETMQRALAPTDVVIPYASTEALMPITLIGADDHIHYSESGTWSGKGTPLGRAAPETQVAIIEPDLDITSFDVAVHSLPPESPGEIIVTGTRVTHTYFHRPEAERESKLTDTCTGEIWHRTGDYGYMDVEGRLWYLCRKKNVIDSHHGPLYPDALEQMWNLVTGFPLSGVVYLEDLDRIFYAFPDEQDPAAIDLETMAILADRLRIPHPTPLQLYGPLPTDPRHNSKIDRAELQTMVTKLVDSEEL